MSCEIHLEKEDALRGHEKRCGGDEVMQDIHTEMKKEVEYDEGDMFTNFRGGLSPDSSHGCKQEEEGWHEATRGRLDVDTQAAGSLTSSSWNDREESLTGVKDEVIVKEESIEHSKQPDSPCHKLSIQSWVGEDVEEKAEQPRSTHPPQPASTFTRSKRKRNVNRHWQGCMFVQPDEVEGLSDSHSEANLSDDSEEEYRPPKRLLSPGKRDKFGGARHRVGQSMDSSSSDSDSSSSSSLSPPITSKLSQTKRGLGTEAVSRKLSPPTTTKLNQKPKVQPKKHHLTFKKKLKILELLGRGETIMNVSRTLGICHSTVHQIKGQEAVIREAIAAGESTNTKYLRDPVLVKMEKETSTWINDLVQKGVALSKDQIRAKAKELYVNIATKEPNVSMTREFKASQRWMRNFLHRFGLQNMELISPVSTMSSGDSSVEEDTPTTSKKQVRRQEKWKKCIAKRKRDSGESYVSITTKKAVNAPTVGKPCSCFNKCFEKVGLDNIKHIFAEYWGLADHTAQTRYINARVVNHDKNSCVVKGRDSRRKQSRTYTLTTNNMLITVCLQAFLSIHGISEKRVRNAKLKGTTSGTAAADQRGRHEPHNKTKKEIRDLIVAHINQLPTNTSHYSRAKSIHRAYLPPEWSRPTLYKDYERWLNEQGKSELKGSFGVYSDIFKTFNIGIEPPRSDTCTYCDEAAVNIKKAKDDGDDDAARELDIQLEVHLARSKAARAILKVYKKDCDDSLVAICMGLQQQLATPHLSTSVQFYKHKLWTFNFGIHNLKTGEAFFYVWNESKGKRGSDEVASCLHHYLETYVGDHVKKVVIFSDNCGGQNKNTNIVLSYLRLIHSERFEYIEHYFLVLGHSYLPCNRDFGFLEEKLKGKDVYTTDHYVELMKTCRDNNPFKVVEMGLDKFYSFDVLQSHVTKSGLAGAGFKDGQVFIVHKDYKMGVKVKPGYSYPQPKLVKFQKGRGQTYDPDFDLSAVPLPLKYPDGIRLEPNKLRDIKFLSKFVLPQYQPFFTDLFKAQDELPEEVGRGEGQVEDSDPDDPTN